MHCGPGSFVNRWGGMWDKVSVMTLGAQQTQFRQRLGFELVMWPRGLCHWATYHILQPVMTMWPPQILVLIIYTTWDWVKDIWFWINKWMGKKKRFQPIQKYPKTYLLFFQQCFIYNKLPSQHWPIFSFSQLTSWWNKHQFVNIFSMQWKQQMNILLHSFSSIPMFIYLFIFTYLCQCPNTLATRT